MISKLSIHTGGAMRRREDMISKLSIHTGGAIGRREDMINSHPFTQVVKWEEDRI